jgi:hypothetical protein
MAAGCHWRSAVSRVSAHEARARSRDVLWDFSRSSEGQGLVEGRTGQMVMREIVEDYLKYLTWADDGYPRMLEIPPLPAIQGRHGPLSRLRAADL